MTNETTTTWIEIRRRAIMDLATRTLIDPTASTDARAGARAELLASAPIDVDALRAHVGGMPGDAFALLQRALDITREHRSGARDHVVHEHEASAVSSLEPSQNDAVHQVVID